MTNAGQFENLVARQNDIVARCAVLFTKPTVIRTTRDSAALRYLALIFEHHRGIVMLVPDCRSPAFSLIRPVTEAFNRLHVAMFGTDKQFRALIDGSYRTEYITEGQLVDEVSGFAPLFGPLFEKIKTALHGFTHIGIEHLSRMSDGESIIQTRILPIWCTTRPCLLCLPQSPQRTSSTGRKTKRPA